MVVKTGTFQDKGHNIRCVVFPETQKTYDHTVRLWVSPHLLLETLPGNPKFLKLYEIDEGLGLALELQTHGLWMDEFLILGLSIGRAQTLSMYQFSSAADETPPKLVV